MKEESARERCTGHVYISNCRKLRHVIKTLHSDDDDASTDKSWHEIRERERKRDITPGGRRWEYKRLHVWPSLIFRGINDARGSSAGYWEIHGVQAGIVISLCLRESIIY